jgi:hypothetical protein
MKPVVSIAALILLFATVHDAAADDPWNPGFDKCSAGVKHAAVPEIKHMIYDRARKRIVADGWRPRVTAQTEEQISALRMYPGGNADIFWSRGYTEVQACAPTGRGPCNFHFIDDFGNRLMIGTVGEERRKFGSRAIVDYVQVLCPKH